MLSLGWRGLKTFEVPVVDIVSLDWAVYSPRFHPSDGFDAILMARLAQGAKLVVDEDFIPVHVSRATPAFYDFREHLIEGLRTKWFRVAG